MWGRTLMFFSSYAPLFVILAVRFDTFWLQMASAVAAVVGVVAFAALLGSFRAAPAGTHDLVKVQEAGGEAAAYLASYLLPFVTVSRPDARDLLAYGVFLLVAGAIYVRTGAVQVHPLLFVFGYRVLRIEDSNGASRLLITRGSPLPGDRVRAATWSGDVLVERADKLMT